MNADFADVDDIGEETLVGVFEGGGLRRQGFDSRDEHFVGEEAGAGEDGAETDAGKAGRVVAFGWSVVSG